MYIYMADIATKQQAFNTILQFYELAESMLDEVESHPTDDPDHLLDIIEPMIVQIEVSAEILLNQYQMLDAQDEPLNETQQLLLDNAFSELSTAILECKEHIATVE